MAATPVQRPASRPAFKPFVPATETRPELSARALILGALFGVLFGAVTVYVGLRAGLTVATSIPISVLSISILRAFGKASILENNIVQSTGNAGQSIASGVIFTLPALIFLGFDLEASRIFALALFGGWLGVLFMIPLRRQLIVEEHATLIYPEGTACADVLMAGERGGSFASRVFLGLGLGAPLHAVPKRKPLLPCGPRGPNYEPTSTPPCTENPERRRRPRRLHTRSTSAWATSSVSASRPSCSPAERFQLARHDARHRLLRRRTFTGPALSRAPSPSAHMDPSHDLWRTYVRPMGAGAVAAAGLITLLRTAPDNRLEPWRKAFAPCRHQSRRHRHDCQTHHAPRTISHVRSSYSAAQRPARPVLMIALPAVPPDTRRAGRLRWLTCAAALLDRRLRLPICRRFSARIVGIVGSLVPAPFPE